MKNFLQPGNILDLIAPSGGVVSGVPVLIGSILAVPVASVAQGEVFAGAVEGVFTLPKLTANTWAVGIKVNWNDTNGEFQIATSDLDNAATVVEAASSSVSEGKVRLTSV